MTARKEELQALLERVEASSELCSELDAAILSNLGLVRGGVDEIIGYYEWNDLGAGRRYNHPAPVTKSIDAALALVERVLPVSSVKMDSDPSGCGAKIIWWSNGLSGGKRFDGEGYNVSIELAILAALLRALIAQEPA